MVSVGYGESQPAARQLRPQRQRVWTSTLDISSPLRCSTVGHQFKNKAGAPRLGEGDGALDALGALDDGALPDFLLLQQLLVDGVQQRLLRDLRVRTLQRLRDARRTAASGHRCCTQGASAQRRHS